MLLGPGHPIYGAVDEKLRERLHEIVGQTAVYVDSAAESPYRLHFYEISVRGQNHQGRGSDDSRRACRRARRS